MWSNIISIDKRYEREVSYILDSVEGTNEISYATEESENRLFVYLASACEDAERVERRTLDIASTVILDFFKLRFFCDRLRFQNISLAGCALLSSIVHFDRDFERAVCDKTFMAMSDYNLDAAFNFRLGALTDSWDELASVATNLLDGVSSDGELYDIAAFITGSDGGKNRLLMESGRLKNVTCRKNVEVINLFDRYEFNLLSAILGERPVEIRVRRNELSGALCSTLKKMVRVIEC